MWNTTGTDTRPAELAWMIGASLTICGIASYENVDVDSSTIGRSPAMAAPIAMPQYASSATGGQVMRAAYFSSTGCMTRALGVIPTKRAPMRWTRSSSARISSSASAIAAANFRIRGSGIHVLVDLVRGGCRARQRDLGGAADLVAHLQIQRAQPVAIDRARGEQLARVQEDRVALLVPLADRLRGPLGLPCPRDLGVAAHKTRKRSVVAGPARRTRFHEERALTPAEAADEIAHGLVHGRDARAVDDERLDAERARHVGQRLRGVLGGRRSAARPLLWRDAVVLHVEEEWEVPQLRDVQRLVEDAFLHVPVAEEGDRDAVAAQTLAREGRTCGEREAPADYRGGVKDPDVRRRDVERAGASARVAVRAAEDLREDARWIGALRKNVTVIAMRREDEIVLPQRGARSCASGLLTDVHVVVRADEPQVRGEMNDPLLEPADPEHRPQQRDRRIVARHRGYSRASARRALSDFQRR